MFKTFRGNIDSVDYEDLDNYDDNYNFINDDKYRKNGSIRTFFKEFDRDYYKSIRIAFTRKKNNYMEYTSKGDRYENLSSKEYLNMIRSYLRDLINEHKPRDEPRHESNEQCKIVVFLLKVLKKPGLYTQKVKH